MKYDHLPNSGEPNCSTDTGKWADFANIQILPMEEKEGERRKGKRTQKKFT